MPIATPRDGGDRSPGTGAAAGMQREAARTAERAWQRLPVPVATWLGGRLRGGITL